MEEEIMTDNIEIILNTKDYQQILTFKGVITHIQYDKGSTTNSFQLNIDNASNRDLYEKLTSKQPLRKKQ